MKSEKQNILFQGRACSKLATQVLLISELRQKSFIPNFEPNLILFIYGWSPNLQGLLFILEIYKLFGQINDKWQALLLADDCSFVHANMGIHTESIHAYNFFICFCDGSYFNLWNFFRSERCVCQAYADITIPVFSFLVQTLFLHPKSYLVLLICLEAECCTD